MGPDMQQRTIMKYTQHTTLEKAKMSLQPQRISFMAQTMRQKLALGLI